LILCIIRLALGSELEVLPAFRVVAELKITGSQGSVGKNSKDSYIIGHGTIKIAYLAARDQIFENRDRLCEMSAAHQRSSPYPLELKVTGKPCYSLCEQGFEITFPTVGLQPDETEVR
jgi:hypothetical protein